MFDMACGWHVLCLLQRLFFVQIDIMNVLMSSFCDLALFYK